MFSGTITAKLDTKGRVFFPAAFRKLLAAGQQQFVVRRDVHQPCLVLYPYAVWEEEVARLRERLNRWDHKEAMVFRAFLGETEQLWLDSAGRLLLSRRWTESVKLSHEVAFVGVDDRIEIWPADSTPFLSHDDYSAAVQELLGTK